MERFPVLEIFHKISCSMSDVCTALASSRVWAGVADSVLAYLPNSGLLLPCVNFGHTYSIFKSMREEAIAGSGHASLFYGGLIIINMGF
jgi:hypothetical protein